MPTDTKPTKQKVAIIGSGITGIGAAWALSQNSEKFDVTLYEAQDRLGGHTNTIQYQNPQKFQGQIPVDTGFIVFNQRTYPNFLRFLKHLNVEYKDSDMSFAVSRRFSLRDDEQLGFLEWSGNNLMTVFAQIENLWNPQHYLMIFDIVRFSQCSPLILKDATMQKWSIGQYLNYYGYSQSFIDNYLIPMTASIWSTDADECFSDFPAVTLIRFMLNHGLLTVVGQRPQWYTIHNGSINYIEKALSHVKDIRLGSGVVKVERIKDKMFTRNKVVDSKGQEQIYDHVIFSCHGDQALKILKDPYKEETEILRNVKYSKNVAYVHTDLSLMPIIKKTWAAWNYICYGKSSTDTGSKNQQVCLTYWMNLLQSIDSEKYGEILVTLNPLNPPKNVLRKIEYEHPLYNNDLIDAQEKLKKLNQQSAMSNGSRRYFGGAWSGYGFHEDGLFAGLTMAQIVGAEVPFEVYDASHLVEYGLKRTLVDADIKPKRDNFDKLLYKGQPENSTFTMTGIFMKFAQFYFFIVLVILNFWIGFAWRTTSFFKSFIR